MAMSIPRAMCMTPTIHRMYMQIHPIARDGVKTNKDNDGDHRQRWKRKDYKLRQGENEFADILTFALLPGKEKCDGEWLKFVRDGVGYC